MTCRTQKLRSDPEYRAKERAQQNRRHAERMRTDPGYREAVRKRNRESQRRRASDPVIGPELSRKAWEANLRRYFKLTPEDYAALLAMEEGNCHLCKRPESNGKRLAVDHDHRCCPGRRKSCGECVRGLVCWRCNQLMSFADDPVYVGWLSAEVIEFQNRRPLELLRAG